MVRYKRRVERTLQLINEGKVCSADVVWRVQNTAERMKIGTVPVSFRSCYLGCSYPRVEFFSPSLPFHMWLISVIDPGWIAIESMSVSNVVDHRGLWRSAFFHSF